MKTFHCVFILAFTVCGISFAEDRINSSDKKKTARPLWELGFGAGMGLVNIQKSGDAFEIHSEVGKGTLVKVSFFTNGN